MLQTVMVAGVALVGDQALGAEISYIYNPSGGQFVWPVAISADGSVVVGNFDNLTTRLTAAFRWTPMTGLQDLGIANFFSSASAVNADGTVIVGFVSNGTVGSTRALVWRATGGATTFADALYGETVATGVSADGSVVAGSRYAFGNSPGQAFRWTVSGANQGFTFLNGGESSTANAISADGLVVVGTATTNSVTSAVRWTDSNGMQSLGMLNGGAYSQANAVNVDGSVIVGKAKDGSTNSQGFLQQERAFRWTASNNMENLGTLNGGSYSNALAVSADGAVVVGTAYDGADPSNYYYQRAFRWTRATGMVSVDQWMRDNGVSVSVENLPRFATGVSADGSVIVGVTYGDRGFVARGPVTISLNDGGASNPPTRTTTAGLIDIANYITSLSATPRLAPQVQNADLVMNGAHSSPLFMLLDAGQSSASFTGDGGYTSARSAQGGIGAGEFGFGRGIEGGWTVRVAGGGQYARMDTPNAGNSVFSSGYIAPDVSYAVGGGVVATLSGYFNWGKADIRRDYLNGAANDSSFGSAATQTYGVRARLDWQDALKLASTGISPFVSYTYLNSQMNGYTETGGSFPVRFNGSREISNAVRIGADATTPLNDQFALVTRLEYGHRFEKAGAGVSGQILGLSAFSIDGASVQQDWLRGGLGVSYKLGNGDGLVMVNTSNQTGKNTTWVSASYRVKF